MHVPSHGIWATGHRCPPSRSRRKEALLSPHYISPNPFDILSNFFYTRTMEYTDQEKIFFMKEALKEAEIALKNDEIPIGCVLVKEGRIIGRGHNAREELQRAVMHAEIMAIEEGNQLEGNWRLLDTTLFVTVEPCVMCAGAIGLARIPQVVFGASNQKFGAGGSLYDILTDTRLNHRVQVEKGLLEEECAAIMQDFFRQRRHKAKEAKASQVD